jgi:hypothetical protein
MRASSLVLLLLVIALCCTTPGVAQDEEREDDEDGDYEEAGDRQVQCGQARPLVETAPYTFTATVRPEDVASPTGRQIVELKRFVTEEQLGSIHGVAWLSLRSCYPDAPLGSLGPLSVSVAGASPQGLLLAWQGACLPGQTLRDMTFLGFAHDSALRVLPAHDPIINGTCSHPLYVALLMRTPPVPAELRVTAKYESQGSSGPPRPGTLPVKAAHLDSLAWSLRFDGSSAITSSLLIPALRHAFGSIRAMRQHNRAVCVDSCGAIPTLVELAQSLTLERPTSTLVQRLDTRREHCRVRAALRPLGEAQSRTPWLKSHHHEFWRGRYNERGELQRAGYDAYELLILSITRPLAADTLGLPVGVLAESASFDRLLLAAARLACAASSVDASDTEAEADSEEADAETAEEAEADSEPTDKGRADVLVVGGGSVGLTTAVAAKLAGGTVTLWERRALARRTRLHMIDVHELYCIEDGTAGALILVEALGLLDLGLCGFWEQLWHRRDADGRVVGAAYGEDGHAELRAEDVDVQTDDFHWIVNLQIATLERALLFAAVVSGVVIEESFRFVGVHAPAAAGERWAAEGCRTAGDGVCANASFDVLVGADGTRSRVREAVGVPMVQPIVCLHASKCALNTSNPVTPASTSTSAPRPPSCDVSFRLDSECRKPQEEDSAGPLVWQPVAVSLALTVPTPCEAGHAVPPPHSLALLKQSVASVAEAPWDNKACRVTVGLLEEHSRRAAADPHSPAHPRFAARVLGLMGRSPDGARDFALFTNSMRHASHSQKVLSAHGATAVVALRGEALAEAYYRDGSGLNLGLHGATSVGRLFVRPLVAGGVRLAQLAELAREAAEFADEQREDVVHGGLSRAVVDVLTAEYQPLSARFTTGVFDPKAFMQALERSGGSCSAPARHGNGPGVLSLSEVPPGLLLAACMVMLVRAVLTRRASLS